MNFEFFDGTRIAVTNGILTDEECAILHDYAVETKLAETEESRAKMEEDSQYGESAFIQLDHTITRDVGRLRDFWGSKNVHTKLGPKHIQDIIGKLQDNLIPVIEEYLTLIDNPKKFVDPGAIKFDPIHVYSAGHSFNNHVDCHEFALVFYVSNPDQFVGGDLVYDAGPRVTPSRGTLVISPSDMPHEVYEVTDGFRCSLTNFFSAHDEAWADHKANN
jgi:hypothetical protein